MRKYIENPNLPDNRVSLAIVDCNIDEKSIETLKKEGIEIIKTVKCTTLYDAVSTHPDMQIHHLGKNKFVCVKEVADYYKKQLPDAEINVALCNLEGSYPKDIILNGARIGNVFIHKLDYTDKYIIDYYKKQGITLINTNQGYTKCSVCILNKNTIITSDTGINKTASNNSISSIYVNSDKIKLNGLSNGFIGGATGLIDKNTLALNGSIKYLEKTFFDFCQMNNVDIIELNNREICDIGSILPICSY